MRRGGREPGRRAGERPGAPGQASGLPCIAGDAADLTRCSTVFPDSLPCGHPDFPCGRGTEPGSLPVMGRSPAPGRGAGTRTESALRHSGSQSAPPCPEYASRGDAADCPIRMPGAGCLSRSSPPRHRPLNLLALRPRQPRSRVPERQEATGTATPTRTCRTNGGICTTMPLSYRFDSASRIRPSGGGAHSTAVRRHPE